MPDARLRFNMQFYAVVRTAFLGTLNEYGENNQVNDSTLAIKRTLYYESSR